MKSTLLLAACCCMTLLAGSRGASAHETLRDAAGDRFLVGAAIAPAILNDPAQRAMLVKHFSSITGENAFKPDQVQPKPGTFTFAEADRIAAFATQNKQVLIGHTLLWHQQTAKWMFEAPDGSPLPREQGLANLRAHINTVVGRYRGQVHGWDVVNEALDDGEPYLRQTPALRSIGDDYILRAFEFARLADPDVQLYYNDYNIELPHKRAKAIRLLRELKAAGARVDAVGIQGHWSLSSPDVQTVDDAVAAFKAEGLRVHITELDVDVLPRATVTADIAAGGNAILSPADNPYVDGLPTAVQTRLAERYAALFRVFLKHDDAIERVTFWGPSDGWSWLNSWPTKGRTNHPLLFDRQFKPKPAFDAVMGVLREGGERATP